MQFNYSRQSVIQDGGIVVLAATVGSSDDGLLLNGWSSGNEAGNSERGGDFLGEVHVG